MVGTAEGDLPKLFSLNKGDLSLIFIQRHRLNYFNLNYFSSASDNFLGENDSIFSIGALREKLSHFDLKSWVKF